MFTFPILKVRTQAHQEVMKWELHMQSSFPSPPRQAKDNTVGQRAPAARCFSWNNTQDDEHVVTIANSLITKKTVWFRVMLYLMSRRKDFGQMTWSGSGAEIPLQKPPPVVPEAVSCSALNHCYPTQEEEWLNLLQPCVTESQNKV